jgi:hypothetical protein
MAWTYDTGVEAANRLSDDSDRCMYVFQVIYAHGEVSEVTISNQSGVEWQQRQKNVEKVDILHQAYPSRRASEYAAAEQRVKEAVQDLYRLGALEEGISELVSGVVYDVRREKRG